MKKMLLLLLLASLQTAHANGHRHNKDCPSSCPITIPVPGPQGERGEPGQSIVGPAGESIVGASGVDGKNGLNGRDGIDATDDRRMPINFGVGVRWYDWKHVSLNSGVKYDVNQRVQRKENVTVDALILQVKFGSSYEDRQMAKMRTDLNNAIAALQKETGYLSNAVNGINERDAQPKEIPTKAVIRGSR